MTAGYELFWQALHVTAGVGLAGGRGDPLEGIRGGDRVFFEPGENHWRGAGPTRCMTHLALQQVDEQGSRGAGLPSVSAITGRSASSQRCGLLTLAVDVPGM